MTSNNECLICEYLSGVKPTRYRLVTEMFSCLDNKSTADILTEFIGDQISADDVLQHKTHNKDWLPIREELEKIDVTTDAGRAQYFVLDGIHASMLRPTRTSPYAAISAINATLSAKQQEADTTSVETFNIIQQIKQIILEEISDIETRARISQRLDHIIRECLERDM